MPAFNTKSPLSRITIAASCATVLSASAAPNSSLLTSQQLALDKGALSLQNEPAVRAARDAAIQHWSEHSTATSADAKASLPGAVDELVYHALRAAIADDPAQPKVAWTLAPAYSAGQTQIPGSRFGGDSPDRIYRYAAADPAYRYEIRGQRGPKPAQHEFSFESTGSIALNAPVKVALYSRDIDVAKDGSFVVTADSTPADGRRNHLQLPEGTKAILIRDTVADWSTDYNSVTIARLDGIDGPARSHEDIVKVAATTIADAAKFIVIIFDAAWKYPPNEIKPFVRPYDWGVPGNVLAINRFSLKKDEALVITLLPSGANYVSVQLTDSWSRSIDYWHRTSSLSDHQVIPNADGSITYVISAKDPGVHNWLDNGGMRDGLILARWELFPQPLPPGNADQLVREVRKVTLSELASALPEGMAKETPAGRKQQLETRAAEFAKRVALK